MSVIRRFCQVETQYVLSRLAKGNDNQGTICKTNCQRFNLTIDHPLFVDWNVGDFVRL
jgi:hypothetical protein